MAPKKPISANEFGHKINKLLLPTSNLPNELMIASSKISKPSHLPSALINWGKDNRFAFSVDLSSSEECHKFFLHFVHTRFLISLLVLSLFSIFETTNSTFSPQAGQMISALHSGYFSPPTMVIAPLSSLKCFSSTSFETTLRQDGDLTSTYQLWLFLSLKEKSYLEEFSPEGSNSITCPPHFSSMI